MYLGNKKAYYITLAKRCFRVSGGCPTVCTPFPFIYKQSTTLANNRFLSLEIHYREIKTKTKSNNKRTISNMTKPGETTATSLNAKTLKSFQSTLPVPVSYTHLDVYKRQH